LILSSKKRRALSEVISSVILSAAVLVVGGMIWNYANGASSVVAAQYHDESMELVKQLEERYMVEHVTNNSTHLSVWIYNYGRVDVELVIYANINGSQYYTDQGNPFQVQSKSSVNAVLPISINSGDNIGLNVFSRRQNNVYYAYIAK
jgi:hypothetical protein